MAAAEVYTKTAGKAYKCTWCTGGGGKGLKATLSDQQEKASNYYYSVENKTNLHIYYSYEQEEELSYSGIIPFDFETLLVNYVSYLMVQ